MLLVNIALGLVGLGIVVFVHELGHFLCARAAGIKVEAFSIGWGNAILKKKIGDVEYRLGAFPVGGYCKFKNETDYNEAWENMNRGIQPEAGSFLGASPQRRILACFGGPFFNLVFAAILLSFIWGFGFEVNTLGNRIILASEVTEGVHPADEAGFMTGDRIIEINGRRTSYFHEIQESIALNAQNMLTVTVERDGEIIDLNVLPDLDRATGAGRIGIFFWSDPIIGSVAEGGLAQTLGLEAGDLILSANGVPLRNSMDFSQVMEGQPSSLSLEFYRNGNIAIAEFTAQDLAAAGSLGFGWETISFRTPSLSAPAAVARGVSESWRTLVISVRSLRLLFQGIDLTQAVSGPVRITYMMGGVATQGFGQSFGTGLRSLAEFLAIISIALCMMNLLPLPVLDGGMIVLYTVELIRRKPAHPKVVNVFQTCGIVLIGGLMFFALFGDIRYLIGRL
ncbi:MAG: RIP metalloprotease RseP [Spirochaetes bacterium]|nr:RIP metalloprotease RseP [Spirochaetota bacterium]